MLFFMGTVSSGRIQSATKGDEGPADELAASKLVSSTRKLSTYGPESDADIY